MADSRGPADADLEGLQRWVQSLHQRLIAVEKRAPAVRSGWKSYEHDENGVLLEAGVELLEGEGRQVVFEGTARVYRGTQIVGPVVLGDGVFVNRGCFIQGETTIGREVAIGPGAQILTDTHELGGPAKRAGAVRVKPVHIGDGAWIGAGAIVLPGITVGPGAVVAAGAVITRDVPPSTLVAGSPATVKRHLDTAPKRGVRSILRRLLRR